MLLRNPVPSPAHLLRKRAGLYTGEFKKCIPAELLALPPKRDLSRAGREISESVWNVTLNGEGKRERRLPPKRDLSKAGR
jgi:hypothetical protein